MKKTITRLFIILFFTTIFISCESQEQTIKNAQKYSYKEYTMKEANEIPQFKESKSFVDKLIADKIATSNVNAREVLGFIIDEALIKEITVDGYISYNMLIKRAEPTPLYFENLVIEVKNDSTNAYLVKYTPEDMEYYQSNFENHNDFEGTIDVREAITILGGSGGDGVIGGGDDTTTGGGVSCVTVYKCFISDPDRPNISIPHYPYCGGCEAVPFVQCGSSIIQINPIPGVSGNSGSTPHGGNSGSNTNNTTTVTTNPVVVPVGPAPINLDFPPATDNGLYETNIITTQFYNPLPHNRKGYLHQNQTTRLIYQSICDYLALHITNDIINPEALSFVNEILTQMMQNPTVFTSITPFIIEKNIDDLELDDCSKGILNVIRNSQNNDVATIIAKLDSSPSIYNTKIKPANLGSVYYLQGKTNWSGLINNGNNYTPFDYTIEINSNVINQGTKLSMYSTMLHELIHAYFLSLIDDCHISSNCALLQTYPELWNYYVLHGAQGNGISQHNQMALTYVNIIATAMQEFQPGLPQQYYQDLAWSGLESTTPYLNDNPLTRLLTPQDRKRIEAINYSESSNLSQPEYNSDNSGQIIANHSPLGTPCP